MKTGETSETLVFRGVVVVSFYETHGRTKKRWLINGRNEENEVRKIQLV